MDDDSIPDAQREADMKLLIQECGHLLTEIERLQMNREMQDDRVQNVKHLVSTIFFVFSPRLREGSGDRPTGVCYGQYRRQ
jgi:hypothetical protein